MRTFVSRFYFNETFLPKDKNACIHPINAFIYRFIIRLFAVSVHNELVCAVVCQSIFFFVDSRWEYHEINSQYEKLHFTALITTKHIRDYLKIAAVIPAAITEKLTTTYTYSHI